MITKRSSSTIKGCKNARKSLFITGKVNDRCKSINDGPKLSERKSLLTSSNLSRRNQVSTLIETNKQKRSKHEKYNT